MLRRLSATGFIAGCLLVLSGVQALAIPAFARKYGVVCGMCHVTWPRLNDFGQKFRMNGYQMPGAEAQEKTILELPGVPLSARTAVGYTFDTFSPKAGGTRVSQFEVNGLDLLGGGVLGRNIGFFLTYLPQISPQSGVEAQDGEIEQANVVFSRLHSTWLNLRVGRFDPAYVPFSPLRSLSVSPYEIYAFNGSPQLPPAGTVGSLNSFAMADTADGIELYGWGNLPLQYAVGITNGSRANNQDDGPSDIYGRAAWVFGPGFGQTAGQRVGVLGYLGRARAAGGGPRQAFNRLGVDANLNKGPFNLQLLYLHGHDNGAFNVANPGHAYDFDGGFAQLNYFMSGSAGFLRYGWVSTPASDRHDISRITAGWRQQLAYSLMLQVEYSHRRVENGAGPGLTQNEDFATARLDFAF